MSANCSVSGCDGTVIARGWCNVHYQRAYRQTVESKRDRDLAAARQRAYLARKAKARVPAIDDLWITCWMEEAVLLVPRALVLEGRTETCGREGCEAA